MLTVLNDKTESPKGVLSALLGLKAGEKDDKFSLILNAFSADKMDEKVLDLKAIDSLVHAEKESKESAKAKTPLARLFALGNEDASDEEQIHPEILKVIPNKGFKENLQHLITEAKSFLKGQILQKIDAKELPKTLGGLIKLAERSGVDIQSIRFDSLPDSSVKEELMQVMQNIKPGSVCIPHSTSELVRPLVQSKSEKDSSSKPLASLLNPDKTSASMQEIPERASVIPEETFSEEGTKTPKNLLFNSSLQSLLHGEESQHKSESESGIPMELERPGEKGQVIQPNKTDLLSQKITEAKQLVQHVAHSMKEAVENYKPPFTRIKMQLNPHRFGEMDVTLIQRGNNVHININANTTALTVMMQNAHELKTALSSQGLGDAQMNFSSQHQGEQKQQEHAHRQYETYQEFEALQEEFDEIATALEVVVPRYI